MQHTRPQLVPRGRLNAVASVWGGPCSMPLIKAQQMELSSQRGLQYILQRRISYCGYLLRAVQYCIEATTREMRDCLPYTVGDLCKPARVTGPAVDLQITALGSALHSYPR